MNNEFIILGDLGNGHYIVRMFVGQSAYDEEFTSPLDLLRDAIEGRMSVLAQAPDGSTPVDAARPQVIQHAVTLP